MNVYEIVTEKIVSQLEAGVIPWRKPWASIGAPRNLVSGKPYRGINTFLLSASKYASPFWMTYKQARELGGNVKAGEKSTLIVFWKVSLKRDPEAAADEVSSADRASFVLRYYNVFNSDQCENFPDKVTAKIAAAMTSRENPPIGECDNIIANMPKRPEIIHAGAQAFYTPKLDTITLPGVTLFASPEAYYATAFHELAHSTGHTTRLAREGIENVAPFGSAIYSREELVAEMGAAFLCAEAGISPAVIDNQAAYISGWLDKLRAADDKRMVVIAAAQAQKAADFILDRKFKTEAE